MRIHMCREGEASGVWGLTKGVLNIVGWNADATAMHGF